MDLEKFAQRLFELSDWPEGGDIDAVAFQDAAIECGLLTPETRTEPCDQENCHCSEYHEDMSKGVTCYRKAQFCCCPTLTVTPRRNFKPLFP